ncbi:hypothetical protein PGT21_000611 [Puccinia graminis f. sp. tritici]|uniref:Uncharacterized protein n=1 Tax=Puccinia graminis f. sp. tritici TaxID=56615 RepID=A0A5B0N8E6_PUCGR|nr:hypothetical protein PGT21_000611 [Puccinia graminis f. sp. tritici]
MKAENYGRSKLDLTGCREEDEPSGGAVPRLARRVAGRGRSGLYILLDVSSQPATTPRAHDPWDSSRADHLHLQPRDKTSTNIIWLASSTLFPPPQKPRSTLKANLTNQATVRTVSTRAVFQAINQFIVFSRNRQSQIIYRTKTLQLAPRADSCTPSDHSNRLVSTLGPWITSQTTSSIESSIHHHPSTDSPS